MNGKPDLAEGFTLRCLQRLSRPYVGYPAMLLAEQLAHQRYVPPSPLVLGRKPLKFPAPATDRDRPVSRRSKPSSRTAFIGEQPNPWELLHPQDAMSRHRGAKPPRRCERSAILLHARGARLGAGVVVSATLCTSPCSSDCIITPSPTVERRGPGVQSLRGHVSLSCRGRA